ncbi:MAG: hypothetical protein IPL72_07445 [Sulfuritalea sp.]|nr:hypothetical protein [Sulfuritalea sp.]
MLPLTRASSRMRAVLQRKDAFTLAQSTFDDAASAAKEYLDATAKFAGKNSEARIALTETLDAARKTAREVEAVLKDEVTAEVLDNLHHIDGALAQADAIRKAVATDIDRLSDRLAALPLAERERAEEATRFFMDSAKNQFEIASRNSGREERRSRRRPQGDDGCRENIRPASRRGKVDELERLTKRRAKDLRETLSYSQELQGRIDELETNLLPLKDHKRELNDIITQSEVFRREMKESGIPTGYFDASIVGNTWAGVPVPNEIANAVNKYKSVPGAQRRLLAALAPGYDLVNDVFRFIGATADVSRTAIQGLLGIGENPDITRKAIGVAIKALKDPEEEFTFLKQIEQEMVDEGLGTLARAVGVGKLEIAHAEYLFRGVSDENSMLAALAKKKPLSWFEILFSTPGNAERYLRYQDYMRAAKLAGKDVDDVRVIRDSANAANMVTGRSSQGVLTPIIGERGSSRVLFAGRFVQSQFDTVYNALLVGGIEGEVARRSLLRLVLGGSALTYMINEANGEKTDWRPIVDGIPNPNFARVRVAGHDISLFGPWDSLAKGLISTYQGDPSSFFRSKMA